MHLYRSYRRTGVSKVAINRRKLRILPKFGFIPNLQLLDLRLQPIYLFFRPECACKNSILLHVKGSEVAENRKIYNAVFRSSYAFISKDVKVLALLNNCEHFFSRFFVIFIEQSVFYKFREKRVKCNFEILQKFQHIYLFVQGKRLNPGINSVGGLFLQTLEPLVGETYYRDLTSGLKRCLT